MVEILLVKLKKIFYRFLYGAVYTKHLKIQEYVDGSVNQLTRVDGKKMKTASFEGIHLNSIGQF